MNILNFLQIFTFVLVVIFTIAIAAAGEEFLKVRRRLRGEYADPVKRGGGGFALLKAEALTHPVLLWVQNATLQRDQKEREKITKSLTAAGFGHSAAPATFVIVRFSLAVGLPTAFVVSQHFAQTPMTGLGPLVMSLVCCVVGLAAPGIWVNGRAAARQTLLEQQFPDSLDLLVVCMDAGLGLDGAFQRVGREIEHSHPMVSELFTGVSSQLAAGRSRADALRGMAEKGNLESIRSFVSLLIQTDTLGVSVAQTLQNYAAEMRAKRFTNAEEKAMQVPLLITLPLITCLLPVIVGVLLIPPIIDMVRRFAN